jgi:hypothetical protein
LKFPADEHIEKYVRYREELSAEEVRWIEASINENKELRLLADWFADFYELVDKPATEDLIRARPDQIELLPMKREYSNNRSTFVLAAQSSTIKKGKLVPVNTFISEEYKTLLRVLYDPRKDSTRVHLLCGKLQEDEISLLYVPDRDLHLVLHPGGKLEIPCRQIGKEEIEAWSFCKLLLPVLKSKLDENASNRSGFVAARSGEGLIETVELTQQETQVTLDIPAVTGAAPRMMLIH